MTFGGIVFFGCFWHIHHLVTAASSSGARGHETNQEAADDCKASCDAKAVHGRVSEHRFQPPISCVPPAAVTIDARPTVVTGIPNSRSRSEGDMLLMSAAPVACPAAVPTDSTMTLREDAQRNTYDRNFEYGASEVVKFCTSNISTVPGLRS